MMLYRDFYLVQDMSSSQSFPFMHVQYKKNKAVLFSSVFHSGLKQWNKLFHWGSLTAEFTAAYPVWGFWC